MKIVTEEFTVNTRGMTDMIDITEQIEAIVRSSGLQDGSALVFSPGSTSGITTIEFEPGALDDLKSAFERLAPIAIEYRHDRAWGDGNGFSHVRSALLGGSISIPFIDRELALGRWQQVTLIDFDNRARSRRIIVQLHGQAERE